MEILNLYQKGFTNVKDNQKLTTINQNRRFGVIITLLSRSDIQRLYVTKSSV